MLTRGISPLVKLQRIMIDLMPREKTKGDNPHKIVVQTGSC